jgi:RNA polymerase sigma-70 factor, ECF subfamily
MTENQLITALQQGDVSAFKYLLRQHQRQVLTICYRFVLNQQDAEDIAQEVFIEVFHSIHEFRREASFNSWIYRIAVTKSLDELRHRKRKKRISSIGKLFDLEEWSHRLAGKSRPDTDLEKVETWNQLLALLDQLPENQRVAFTLSKIQHHSNTEIAEIMLVTVSAVESLIHRARVRLKTEIAKRSWLTMISIWLFGVY